MAVTSTHADPRRGRRLGAVGAAALVVALGLLAVLLAGRGRFDGAVVSPGGDKVHVAREGQRVLLRFVDRERAGTAYRAEASTGATRYALAGRTGKRGAASRLTLLPIAAPSRVSVSWIVGGRMVARWVFLVRPRRPGG